MHYGAYCAVIRFQKAAMIPYLRLRPEGIKRKGQIFVGILCVYGNIFYTTDIRF